MILDTVRFAANEIGRIDVESFGNRIFGQIRLLIVVRIDKPSGQRIGRTVFLAVRLAVDFDGIF